MSKMNESDILDDEDQTIIRDWRIQCTTSTTVKSQSHGEEIHKSGVQHINMTVIKYPGKKNYLTIPIPNPSAIYLSLAYQAKLKAGKFIFKLGKRLPDDSEFNTFPNEKITYLFDGVEQLISCIIFSYTAIEAFANESIPDNYHFEQLRKDKKCKEIYSKDQIERYIKLDTKLDEILPVIYSLASPKGLKLWNNFIKLEGLRDKFIHLKKTDWEYISLDKGTINNIWIKLLSEEALKTPFYALELIRYYHQKNEPRWLRKTHIKLND